MFRACTYSSEVLALVAITLMASYTVSLRRPDIPTSLKFRTLRQQLAPRCGVMMLRGGERPEEGYLSGSEERESEDENRSPEEIIASLSEHVSTTSAPWL